MCSNNYNFDSDFDGTGSEQFTRMVWRSNSKIGIGVAKKDVTIDNLNISCYFFVARYNDNPLKYFNSYKTNVLKGHFNTTLCNGLSKFADDELAKRAEAAAKDAVEAHIRSEGKDKVTLSHIVKYTLKASMSVATVLQATFELSLRLSYTLFKIRIPNFAGPQYS